MNITDYVHSLLYSTLQLELLDDDDVDKDGNDDDDDDDDDDDELVLYIELKCFIQY